MYLLQIVFHGLQFSSADSTGCVDLHQVSPWFRPRDPSVHGRHFVEVTYLAFIFVPLSLTSSFFGMNVQGLGSGPILVWQFFVSAVGVLLGSLFIVSTSSSSFLTRNQRVWRISLAPSRMIQAAWTDQATCCPNRNLTTMVLRVNRDITGPHDRLLR